MATDRGRPREQQRGLPGQDNVIPLRGRSSISDARRYTPRARTVKEAGSVKDTARVKDAGHNTGHDTGDDASVDARPARPPRKAPVTKKATAGTRPSQKPSSSTANRTTTRPRTTASPRPPARSRRPVLARILARVRDSALTRLLARFAHTPAFGFLSGLWARIVPRSKGSGNGGGSGKVRKKAGSGPDVHRRLRFSAALLLVLFAVLGGRLIQLQITDAASYAARGLEERLASVTVPAPRGSIVDRNGAVLSHSVEARFVYADPPMVKDAGSAAEKLSPILGMSKTELWQKLQVTKHPSGAVNRYMILRRGLDIDTGNAIKNLKITGIVVDRDTRREVPGNDLASNILGFANGEGRGAFGMEAAYDHILYGQDGKREFETSATGQEIPSGFHRDTPARPGGTVRLTIDRDLQFETQRTLTERMSKARAQFSCAVVMDVKTGEVLAMASTPAYDAANPQSAPPADSCSQVTIDPGSIHKAITVGSALQEGIVKPDSLIFTEPTLKKGDQVFKDTHFHAARNMTLPGIMAHSSNVGTIHIADSLGSDKLYNYQRKFGLGTPTGLGLPGEASGLVQPPKNWSGSAYGSIPIGLGVSVTPMQMVAAYGAIANDGVWVQPQLVKETAAPGAGFKPAAGPKTHRVLDATHALETRKILEAVTTVSDGTGTSARVRGYRVAGKTGTGLYVVDGKYARGEVASFIGMDSVDNPRYVVGVFAYSPGGEGGTVAGPVFRDVMSFTLGKYGVLPTETKAPDFSVYG